MEKNFVNQVVEEYGVLFLHCNHGERIKDHRVEHEWSGWFFTRKKFKLIEDWIKGLPILYIEIVYFLKDVKPGLHMWRTFQKWFLRDAVSTGNAIRF